MSNLVIFTKFIPASNVRGSRIKAFSSEGAPVTIDYKHELDTFDNHKNAAIEFMKKNNISNGILLSASTKDGYAHFVGSKNPREVRKGKPVKVDGKPVEHNPRKHRNDVWIVEFHKGGGGRSHVYRIAAASEKSAITMAKDAFRRDGGTPDAWEIAVERIIKNPKHSPEVRKEKSVESAIAKALHSARIAWMKTHKKKPLPYYLKKKNPIQRPGKFEGETYAARYAYENPDDEIGSSSELGWFGKFSGKIKGRGPFYIIVSEDNNGFVHAEFFDSEAEFNKAWSEIEAEYEKYYENLE
jgi:1,2-phenylacetyl-CoA epoxidase PaaB subunit